MIVASSGQEKWRLLLSSPELVLLLFYRNFYLPTEHISRIRTASKRKGSCLLHSLVRNRPTVSLVFTDFFKRRPAEDRQSRAFIGTCTFIVPAGVMYICIYILITTKMTVTFHRYCGSNFFPYQQCHSESRRRSQTTTSHFILVIENKKTS